VPSLNIFNLYPNHLNLYGDRGNVIAVKQRAQWQGIDIIVTNIEPGEHWSLDSCDLLLMGGGEDSSQLFLAADLQKRKSDLQRLIEKGMPLLAICGSYQLLGHYYTAINNENIPGLGIIDLHTLAKPGRLIGNISISCPLWLPERMLVGFENHAGRTYLGPALKPLGKVIKGHGNNGSDSTEGVIYHNLIGSYMHGPLLPKNPWLTDYLLEKALAYRKISYNLPVLDDTLETAAHKFALRL